MNHRITQTLSVLMLVALVATLPQAQQLSTLTRHSLDPLAIAGGTETRADRVELYQALLDLQNPWTVMCVAAHPDDEDGTSLIVMRHKYGAHTVSLFSTFGEGGQNAIGPELYEELGAIRARETMAAAEIQGSEPHFLGLKDFGFSKTRDEAFKFWGHEEALRRMVLEIRKLRPDVIITNHSTTSNDHGQHQATALMVVEAFDAAADPTKFPEQLKDGVSTWQVQRLFVRQRGNAQQNPDRQGGGQPIVTIDPNERDPVRGVVYAEEALRALQQHATQGPWPKTFAEFTARFRAFSGQSGTPGQMPMIRYALVREAKGAAALSAKESHTFLDGLQLSDQVTKRIQPPTIEGKPLKEFVTEPGRILAAMIAALRARTFSPERPHTPEEPGDSHMDWVAKRTDAALALASGITTTLRAQGDAVVPGTQASFVLKIANTGSRSVKISRAVFYGLATFSQLHPKPALSPGESIEIEATDRIVPDEKITVPHFVHLYDGGYVGRRERGFVVVEVAGYTFSVPYDLYIDVAPPIEIASVNPSVVMITPQTESGKRTFALRVLNHGAPSSVSVSATLVVANPSEQIKLSEEPLSFGIGQERDVQMSLPFEGKRVTVLRRIHFSSNGRGSTTTIEEQLMNRNPKVAFRTADRSSNEVSVPLVYADAHVAPNLRVAYIRGFDFSLPNALNALGVESKELSVDDVKTGDLSKYTSVIVDNRVYESKPELIAVNQKLLDYAQAGGNLIVFYHKNDEWNPDERRNRPQLAPYKLILGNERVTDENAPITFLEPDHPLLNVPNKLNQDDFKDWIQERGLYYPKEWDPQFHALLQSNDPGEQPLKGGLLVADYGKGHYIYTSMVWYRELRGGIPGAYRMLANMISYGR